MILPGLPLRWLRRPLQKTIWPFGYTAPEPQEPPRASCICIMIFCTTCLPMSKRLCPSLRRHFFSTSKLFFSYGRNNSLDAPSIRGSAVILNPGKPDPETVMNYIEKYRPTLYYSVPTSYWALLNFMEKSGRKLDLSSVRLCVSAGEALPKVIYDRWRELFNVEILDGVGSTDVGTSMRSQNNVFAVIGFVRATSFTRMKTDFTGMPAEPMICSSPAK